MSRDRYTIVAAVNDQTVLARNLLLSPDIASGRQSDLLLKEGFRSAAAAYNSAIDEAGNDILVFVHQDVYLPENWFDAVSRAISSLDDAGIAWGVLGSFGVRGDTSGGWGRVYTTGRGLHGRVIHGAEPVETLDEIVLITRRSSGLRFDSELPHFHLYGTDLCLQARSAGLPNFAIPAFCVHNTNQLIELPTEFYRCHDHIKMKWRQYLPIHTSCIVISRFDRERHERRLKAFFYRVLGRVTHPLARVDDPRKVCSLDLQIRRGRQ
jgi:GT2 family glycosyltransferase